MTPADRATLKRLLGASTFGRGRAYAHQGAVKSCEWRQDGLQVLGEVQGAAAQPYRTSVMLHRFPSKRLRAVDATCTCPVGVNCKHAVALLLADPERSSRSSTEGGPRRPVGGSPLRSLRAVPAGNAAVASSNAPCDPAGWETSLLGLLSPGAEDEAVADLAVGLQFELVTPSTTSPRAISPRPASPRIGVRPVAPGHGGNWVRSGIGWANLDSYYVHGRSRQAQAARQIVLLNELLSLTRAGAQRSYYRAPDLIWLETINSRRLWDLLDEARALGIALVQSGRQPRAVTLCSTPAEVGIDITRADAGLHLEPQVRVGREVIARSSSLLVGRPAHGIVWWDDPSTSPTGARRLSLASLAAPLGEQLRTLLEGVPVGVPGRDQERFVRDALPALLRQVPVSSSDESVELPEVTPPTLALTVSHHAGHRIETRWEWVRRIGDGAWRVGLWESTCAPRDRAAEKPILDAVAHAAGPMRELFEATPGGDRLAGTAELAGMAAARFFTEVLPAVGRLAGVDVVQVGSAPDYREAATPPAVALGGAATGDGDWFDLTVSVSVDGEEVPFADLFVALAEEQTHLMLPSGTYFSLDRDELRQLAALIAEARGLQDVEGDSVRLSRFQASLWEELGALGVLAGQAQAWEESVQALTNAAERTEHVVPSGLDATLRPYQQDGFNWLAFLHENGLGGILADDMGLGKTLQALALMCHIKEGGMTGAPFLVVAPTSVVENWALECRRFAPGLAARTVTETVARRGVKMAELAEEADVVITSYALFRLEYGDYEAVEWAGMLLDEAQFAKNRRSQAYLRSKMLPVRFKVAMTGTPMENNLMELWSLLSITAPGLFTNPDRFSEHYRVPIERRADPDRLAQLRRRMRPLLLRRTKEQVAADLPDKQEQVLEMELDPKHRKVYQTHLQRERQKVLGLLGDMDKNRFEIFRSLTLLRQASLDVSLIDAKKYAKVPSTKLNALTEMVGGIVEDGHRVLVFSQFTRFLTSAGERLQAAGIDHCYLDGKTRNRPAVISHFRNGSTPAFLISLKAGGFGLNLTEADYCILLDPWWNPATEAQAVDRIHRIGQTRKVMVYRLVAKETIEEKVMALKARKAALFANVIDAGGFESGALTAEDIRGLLS
ncbi:MAG: DEAD/DEAH box helicase [Actinomycetota bacterium]|nr:DEAD/DEAH box helicase [Actinomycetota bacterium]